MQEIIQCLNKDDEFLAALLKTSYFTWQQKYLQTVVRFGNLLIPRKKPWQIRDIIMLVKNELSKVHLVASLMNHSKHPDYGRYVLNEKELFELHKFTTQPEADFVGDLSQAISPLSDNIKERANKFVQFLDPTYIPNFNKKLDFEPSIIQVKTILETIGIGVKIDTEPLKPILKSITDYINNHIKITKPVNYVEVSNSPCGTVEEVIEGPLLITDK